ncbi:hypothetical protein M011DRAFT_452966 [Sporormia fimetaria CBS 119925]|uniref:Nucleoporin Nup133/Nup155-like C-terminal domain-containing protein n=1 Tax=Sporormia fimetaria CBS 119925 TaxID=1340428 RepID=A0A6A6UYH4_9PLEO|nr:hypothetical protein M011DRAFT_452966 [Sporormia fimetaria CBS 119925]
MFSPEATVQGVRGRNPRRRQRKDSDGPLQPRRKRSKMTEDMFNSQDGLHMYSSETAITNGHAINGNADQSLVLVEMPVREKKVAPTRTLKEDAVQYLTRNENYSVKKLPSFPETLSQSSTPFRAFALPSAGLAVAFTSTQALAWDYTVTAGAARVIALPLPFDLRPTDPLPLGAIVRNGPANEFGVVAVAPSRGKIIFWENVDSAQVRTHFAQRPQGIQASVKLYSTEVITHLVDIDHAGYVLVLSSGRAMHLTLRDSQGRPSISTSALNTPGSSGSLFSFSGLLGGGVKKSVVAVRSRPSAAKGQIEVITATKDGHFRVWDLNWSGQQMFKGEVDIHDQVLDAVQSGVSFEVRSRQEAHILDFAVLEPHAKQGTLALLLLVALQGASSVEYSLAKVELAAGEGVVRRVIPLRNFQQAHVPKELQGTLLLPSPGHAAYVQFPGALAIASLAETEESPDMQLLADSGRPAFGFQDTIYLKEDHHLQISGVAAEPLQKKDKNSRVVLFVQGCGILRVNTNPPPAADENIGRRKVTAKSKLEQSVFYGALSDNVLDFSIRSKHTFNEAEVEAAALEISGAVLSSSYPQLNNVASMEEQLGRRSQALRTLITVLQVEFPQLSFTARWQLLCNAEKIAAALKLWEAYQKRVQEKTACPEAYPESLLLPHMVKCVHERYKTQIRPESGETDPVRHYFLRDIHQLEILLPWAWLTLRTFFLNDKTKERKAIMQRLSEGDDVFATTLNEAFEFRSKNLELYGFDPEDFSRSLLLPNHGQDMLPQFWTSTHNIVSAIRSLVGIGRNLSAEMFEHGGSDELAMKVAGDNPILVNLSCKTHIERFNWALAQADEKIREMGSQLQNEWLNNVRADHIYGLADIGQADAGMKLAQEYKDMTTLAQLVWDEIRYYETTKNAAQTKMEQAECVVKLNRMKEQIQGFFEKYGSLWGDEFYKQFIKEKHTERLFHKDYLNQPALTKFLRQQPVGKLRWINEVLGERNYEGAYDALLGVANQETNLWCKKVDLAMAKLTMLCSQEQSGKEPDAESKFATKMAHATFPMEVIKIQERLYERFAPFIEEAVDEQAAVDILMGEFGQGALAQRPAHQQLLRQGFDIIVHHRTLEPALLVDVLTLMTYDDTSEPMEITQGNEFAFALQAVMLSWYEMNRTTRHNMLRLIWKRVCIKDNWAELNNTRDISDERLEEVLADTTLGRTLKSLLDMIDERSFFRHAWPKGVNELLGAGCTNGELCVRFASEDLRNPIIADNLADDELLQANLEKHRLEEWFPAVLAAAKKWHAAEREGNEDEGVDDGMEDDDEGVEESNADGSQTPESQGAAEKGDVEMMQS